MAKDPAVLADGATYVKAENIKSLFGVECSVKDGKATLTVDGKQVALDSAVVDENLISIRAVADALDLILGWDDAEKTAIVIDVNNVAKENDVTFDLLKKYMDYSKSMGDTFKTTGEFKGSVEVADETAPLTIAYDGTVDSLASKKGEEATMKLNMDLSKVKTMLQSEEMDESEKAVMETIFKAIESSETKYIYDMEKGIFYMNSSMFSAFGVDPAAWISLDLNAFMNMSGAGSFDMNAILDLAETGDIEGYILEVLKSIPVDSVNSYKEIDESYKAVAAMLGDKAFKQDGDKYTSTYALNEDGTELTYVTTLGSEGDKVNSISIVMKMSADGVKMDMTVSTDKDFKSSMSFTMDIADFMKLYMEFESTYEASAKEPALTLPEGAVVISLNDMMNNLATDVVVTETAVEATEVSKNAAEAPAVEITEIETPVENTEVA